MTHFPPAGKHGGTSDRKFRLGGGLRSHPAAFTLVEVVLAIGIIAFAFVGLMALIPVGLTNFRHALDNSIGSQIMQRLVDEAQQTDYATLVATPSTMRYFDDQGNEVSDIGSSIYTVEVSVVGSTTLPNTSTPATDSLATVTLKIADNPGHNGSPFDSTGTGTRTVAYSTYTALIAKNQ